MVESGDLNSETIALARGTIEQDIAFLAVFYKETHAGLERVIAPSHLSNEEALALYDVLGETLTDPYQLPRFDDLDLDIPPEATEAARFLIDLLLGETG